MPSAFSPWFDDVLQIPEQDLNDPAERARILPRSPTASQHRVAWQAALADAIRDPQQLLRQLDLPMTLLPGARRAATQFPLLVPRQFVARMTPGDIDDPLLRQVLPLDQELDDAADTAAGYCEDPLEETAAQRSPSLLQKYPGRALLITTPACAVHCRYCFRRHYPHDQAREGVRWNSALQTLSRLHDVHELILSGGDPLTLTDERLATLIERCEAIPRLSTLRLHTRLPIVIPARVTDALLSLLASSRLQVMVVVHANHANEIDQEVASGLRRLKSACQGLLNQSVLLRGVNDTALALASLAHRLWESGVLPYYLHLPDAVSGTAHYRVAPERGVALVASLRDQLPGYLVPRLAREIPGEMSKQLLA